MNELIDALRWCADKTLCVDLSTGEQCPRFKYREICKQKQLMHEAADAIERLVKERDELQEQVYLLKPNKKISEYQAAMFAEMEIENKRLQAQVPVWINVEERLPEAHRPVWTAIYTTDLIFVQDGETIEEAAERTQSEAEKHPRCEMGAWNEEDGWYDLIFGAPMVCQPEYWLEIPDAPRKEQTDEDD